MQYINSGVNKGREIDWLDSGRFDVSSLDIDSIKFRGTIEKSEEYIGKLYLEMQESKEKNRYKNRYILITSIHELEEQFLEIFQERFIELLESGHKYGIYFLVITDSDDINNAKIKTKKILKASNQNVLLMKTGSQSLYTTNVKSYNEPEIDYDEGYYVYNGMARKIKITYKVES